MNFKEPQGREGPDHSVPNHHEGGELAIEVEKKSFNYRSAEIKNI
jgi:hypothetical protein